MVHKIVIVIDDKVSWLEKLMEAERWILDQWPSLRHSHAYEQALVSGVSSHADQFYIMPALGDQLIVYFTDSQKALLFKLTWA